MGFKFVVLVHTSTQDPGYQTDHTESLYGCPRGLSTSWPDTELQIIFSQITFLYQPPALPTSKQHHYQPRFILKSFPLYPTSNPLLSPVGFISKKYLKSDLLSLHSPRIPTVQFQGPCFCPSNTLWLNSNSRLLTWAGAPAWDTLPWGKAVSSVSLRSELKCHLPRPVLPNPQSTYRLIQLKEYYGFTRWHT